MKTLFYSIVLCLFATTSKAQLTKINTGYEWTQGKFSKGLTLPKYASDPSGTWEAGSKYFNTTDSTERLFIGTGWVKILTTSTAQARLASGSDLQYYTGTQGLHYFQPDVYAAGDSRYLKIGDSLPPQYIPGLTRYVRYMFSGTGYNPETGQIISGSGDANNYSYSVVKSGTDVLLTNDNPSPGSNKVYGTNGSGVKGWIDAPSGGSGATPTVANFVSIASLKGSTFNTTSGELVANVTAGGRQFRWNSSSTATDDGGVTCLQVTGVTTGRWETVFKGRVRASEIGVKTDGTDQTSLLNSLLSNSSVKDLLLDEGSVTIAGTITVAAGKKLVIQNGAKIIGTGLITGSGWTLDVADFNTQYFGANVRVTGLLNPFISPVWFGAKADAYYAGPTPTDNLPFFNKAEAASYGYKGTVYIPSITTFNDNLGSWYYLSGTWLVDSAAAVTGDGVGMSILYKPDTTSSAIKIVRPGLKALGVEARGVFGSGGAGFNSMVHNGWEVNAPNVILEDCGGSYFAGMGAYVHGDVGYGSNANICKIVRFVGNGNGFAGIGSQGGDANQLTLQSPTLTGNARFGIWASDFLGLGELTGDHIASTAIVHPLNKSVVSYSGHIYICIQDHTNHTPTVGGDAYWQDMGTAFYPTYFTTWSSSAHYLESRSIGGTNANQTAAWIGGYDESDEGLPAIGTNLQIGGTRARHGTIPGAIGNLHGNINALSWWATIPDQTYSSRIEPGFIGFKMISNYDWGFTFNPTAKAFAVNWSGSGSGNVTFLSPESDGTYFGRAYAGAFGNGGGLFARNGLWMDNGSSASNFSLSYGAPSTTGYAVNDLKIDVTTGTLYRCTVQSTTGSDTWVAVSSGGGGGGSSVWSTSSGNAYYNSGNVGVGTASPTAAASRKGFVVRGTSSGAEIIAQPSVSTDGTPDGTALIAVGDDAVLINRRGGTLSLGTNASNNVTIASSGSVGIGTAVPAPPASRNGLVVRGSSSGSEIIAQSQSASDGSANGLAMIAVGTDGVLINRLGGTLGIGTNGSVNMTIASSGNVNLSSLAGTGTRMVVANASGDVSTQTIPSGGEANTSSNVGSGIGLAKAKSGVNLPFKSINDNSGQGVKVTANADGNTVDLVNSAYDLYGRVAISTSSALGQTGRMFASLPNDCTGIIYVEITGRNSTTSGGVTTIRKISFNRVSGSTTLGSEVVDKASETIGTWTTTPTFTWQVSANNPEIDITSGVSDVIYYNITYHISYVIIPT